MSATYKGNPDYYKQINKMVASATEADLKRLPATGSPMEIRSLCVALRRICGFR